MGARQRLADDGRYAEPDEAKIRIGKASCEVIGLLVAKGQAGMGDQDDTIIIPYTSHLKRIARRPNLNSIVVQAQTAEHLTALQSLGIKNIVIAQNKVDLVTKEQAKENFKDIKKFIKGTNLENAPIIPIAAHYGVNIDVLIQAMEEFIQGRTALIIAHRFATVLSADRIVVMNEGQIIDVGTHKELLGRCKLYEHLYRTQFSDAGG